MPELKDQQGDEKILALRKEADAGDEDAQFTLAKQYLEGNEKKLGMKYLKLAADQGNTEAIYIYAMQYFEGKHAVAKNYKIAHEYALMRAKLGNKDCQELIGTMYYIGKGCNRDYPTAKMWLNKAASKGSESAKKKLEYIKATEEIGNDGL